MAVLGCTWGHVLCVILLVCSAFLNLNCVQNAKILQESSFQSEAVRIYLQRQGYIIMSSIFWWTNIKRQTYGCRQKRLILLEYGCKKNPHRWFGILRMHPPDNNTSVIKRLRVDLQMSLFACFISLLSEDHGGHWPYQKVFLSLEQGS